MVKIELVSEETRYFQDDEDVHRYQLHPSGAVTIIGTPNEPRRHTLEGSHTVIAFGPAAWISVEGIPWGGTDDDLDD